MILEFLAINIAILNTTVIHYVVGHEIEGFIEKVETKMSIEEFEEIPVVLKLKKNIAEVLRILAICYTNYNTDKNEILNEFLSKEVTKVIQSLATNPPEPPTFPLSLRDLLSTKVNESNNDNNDSIIEKYTTTNLPSKEEAEQWGKIPPNEEEENDKENLK